MSLKRVGLNIGAGAMARLASAGSGLVLTILMTRLWRPEYVGGYALALTWFQLLQLVPILGLHFQVARDTAADPEKSRARVATAALIGFVAAFPTAGLMIALCATIYDADLLPALSLMALALAPTAPAAVAEMALMGQERLHLVARVNLAESVARVILLSLMMIAGAGPTIVVAGFVALRWAVLFAYLADERTRHMLDPRAATRSALAAHLRQAPALLAILLLSAAFSRLDMALLPLLTGLEDVAVYSIAARLYDLVLMAPSIVMMAIVPALARLKSRSDGALRELVRLVLRYGLIVGIPSAICVGYAIEPSLRLAFGEKYVGAAEPFRYLLAASVVMGLNQLAASVLLVEDKQQLDIYGLAAACLALAVSLPLLVFLMGIAGAAVAALIGAVAQVATRWIFLRKLALGVTPPDFWPPLAAGTAMLAALVLTPAPSPIALISALSAYLVILVLFNGVRRGDIDLLRGLIDKSPWAPSVREPART